jgi:uncharacterized RDD family membrane protein YckC
MHPSDPFARALSARSALPRQLSGLEADPLWAALLTSVQNVVLGEIRAARYPELADESRRELWPELLDRLGHDARVRIGNEIIDGLAVGTVDDLWVTWMRVAGGASGTPAAPALMSDDPAVQEQLIDLLDILGEVVDRQLFDRFGMRPDEERRDAGLVVSLPPTLAASRDRPADVPVFDWAPAPSAHPAADERFVPPGAPGWRPLPIVPAERRPATFGRRAAAFVIDQAITILVTTAAAVLFVWPAAASTSSTSRPDAGGTVVALAFVGVAVVAVGWFLVVAWLTGTRGASPGKRIMRIEVVGFSSPGPIGFGRALLRELILSAFSVGSILTAWLPYASVFWDSSDQLRGWHDKAVDDIVVETASI